MTEPGRLPRRRSIRLWRYDYRSPGACFVTVCAKRGTSPFGEVRDGKMVLSKVGHVVRRCWLELPRHFPHVRLDALCVMPNHVHGIIWIARARRAVPLQDAAPPNRESERRTERFGRPVSGSLPTVIRSFKAAATRRINRLRGARAGFAWQRNYWEHVIRSEKALARIRRYIAENPPRWHLDRENPERVGRDDFERWLRAEAARHPLQAGGRP